MRRSPARREMAFVLAVAAAGLVLVLVVAFVPWYSPGSGSEAEVSPPDRRLVQLIDERSAALTP